MGDFARAHQLLEEAAFSPERLADILNQAGRALGFDHFVVRHRNGAAGPEDMELPADGRLRAFEKPHWPSGLGDPGSIHARDDDQDLDLAAGVSAHDGGSSGERFKPFSAMAAGAGWRLETGPTAWTVALLRAEEPVSAPEVAELERFVPVANRALLMLHRLRETHFRGLFYGLSVSNTAAVLLTPEGKVDLATPLAQRLFNLDFNIRQGWLWSAHAASNERLEALAKVAGTLDPSLSLRPFLVLRFNDARPILAQPIVLPDTGGDGMGAARMAVFLGAPGQTELVGEDDLQLLFGLSKAEARIARLLAEGLEPQQIAGRRNVSVGTIRVQMKHIFQKVKVRRQAELIKAIAELRQPASITSVGLAAHRAFDGT